jgi:hypothetical protein
MPTAHTTGTALSALLTAVAGLASAGCGPSDNPDTRAPTREAAQSEAPHRDTTGRTSPTNIREVRVQIQITVGDQRFQATLADSAAGRDLVAQLPVTLDMVDHGSVEKTGPLPSPLSIEGQPGGADPDVGELGYYAPGGDLVLYYGDQSYFPGIVILGRLDGDAAERIAALDGSITATVQSLRQ